MQHKGQPLDKASKALILLHGRGGTAVDILELADEFGGENFYCIAPQAANNAWYPNKFMADEEQNEPWLSSSVEIVQKIILDIANVIPKKNIYIMGFSQGACLALETTARNAGLYGGVVAFSGGLIGKTINDKKYKGSFEGTKIFIGVSENDPHIPLERAKESKDFLEKQGAEATLMVYPGGGHTINDDEIAWVRKNIFSQS